MQGLNTVVNTPFEEFVNSPGSEMHTTIWVEKVAVDTLYRIAKLCGIELDTDKKVQLDGWLYSVCVKFGADIGRTATLSDDNEWIQDYQLPKLAKDIITTNYLEVYGV